MNLRTLTVLVALVSVVTVVGASAFTTATVARDATINVSADNNGIVRLADGTVDGAAITGDTLEINGESSSEPGLNTDAQFTFGDNSSATAAQNEHAFTITNADDAVHTFNYTFSASPGTMTVEIAHDSDDDGTLDTVTTVDSTDENIQLTASETAYVVVYVDTSGVAAGNTITGTLTINVS